MLENTHTLRVTTGAVCAGVEYAALERVSCAKGRVRDTIGLQDDVALLNAEHREDWIERGARSAEEREVGGATETDRGQRQQSERGQPHVCKHALRKEEAAVWCAKLKGTRQVD